VPCVVSLIDGQELRVIREVLIIDGGSRDATPERIASLAERYPEVRLLENPGRYAPHGLNVGIRASVGRFVLRADAHAVYPPRYVEDLILHHGDPLIANVGGVIESVPGGQSLVARVIGAAMGSVFGVGPSFRTLRESKLRDVDTVPFGCWRRDLFDEVGMFDEAFIRGQDLEFNVRCRQAGYRILCVPSVKVTYANRGTFSALFRMIRQTGFWKIAVNRKHGALSSYRQLAPLLLGLVLVVGLVLTVVAPARWFLWNAAALVYLLSNLIVSAFLAATFRGGERWMAGGLLVYCFAGMHASYLTGYLSGILRRRSSPGGSEAHETTRREG
jgi:GT2 family glycosyltransferase